MALLVSACLLGTPCRYNGTSFLLSDLLSVLNRHPILPVCPETLGGLPTPRPPVEICGQKLLSQDGQDFTAAFHQGAQETLRLAHLFGCSQALLKERSPSCGYGHIYDGSFSGRLCSGSGITASLLNQEGLSIWGESQLPQLLDLLTK